MSDRLPELDALRGLAALTVVTFHVLIAQADQGGALFHRPLICGREAVLLFFVLSGFVLYVACEARPVGYFVFVVKRFFRLYPAYLVAIVGSALGMALLGARSMPGASTWSQGSWSGAVWPSFVAHLDLLRDFSLTNLQPVAWSLVVEVRISLVFPLLAWWVARWPWWASLGGIAVAEVLTVLASHWLTQTFSIRWGWPWTVHFMVLFVIGMVLAKHREPLVAAYRRAAWPVRLALPLAGLVAYYGHQEASQLVLTDPVQWQLATWDLQGMALPARVEDPVVGLGAAAMIVSVLGSRRLGALLRLRPLVWLGEVSYSLYLVHAVILLAALHAAAAWVPIRWLAPATIPLSLLVAYACWRWVELPGQAAGRWLLGLRTARP